MKKKFKVPYFLKKLALGTAVVALPVFTSCEKNQPEIPKKDVRIGYALGNGGTETTKADIVLSEQRINELKSKPETGRIVAYVQNDDGRGPHKGIITLFVNDMERAKSQGVIFENGTLYVDDFEKADSIKARKLPLLLDLYSRSGK